MVNTAETQYVCGLKKEDFQTTIDGKKTDLYILKNAKGNEECSHCSDNTTM